MPKLEIILASTSAIRLQLLQNAGLAITCQTPMIDEEQYKTKNNMLNPKDLALGLANLKAESIITPDAIVIGADQTLSCDELLYNKAKNFTEAKTCLQTLRGKTHTLYSAISICRAGERLFTAVDSAQLTMWNFSDSFLNDYIHACGTDILHSVGCYQLEKQGSQLFEKIEGDYFTILGFPLLPCLAFLRQMKFLKS